MAERNPYLHQHSTSRSGNSGNDFSSTSDDEDSSSSSPSSSSSAAESNDDNNGEDDDATEGVPAVAVDDGNGSLEKPLLGPQKLRLKLSLRLGGGSSVTKTPSARSLPQSSHPQPATCRKELAKKTLPTNDRRQQQQQQQRQTTEDVVSATAVGSSDEEEFDDTEVKALPLAIPASSSSILSHDANKKQTSSTNKSILGETLAKVSSNSVPRRVATSPSPFSSSLAFPRPVRLPPIYSPGLWMQPPTGLPLDTNTNDSTVQTNSQGQVTPSDVFNYAMSLAGYTTEGRTMNPHQGSSLQRVVGDMFDTDVVMGLNFPSLIPEELLAPIRKKKEDIGDHSDNDNDEGENTDSEGGTIPGQVVKAISDFSKKYFNHNVRESTSFSTLSNSERKNRILRKRRFQFVDMVPISLTAPIPESYIAKRRKYIEEVEAREKAIDASQDAADAADDAKEAYEEAKEEWVLKMGALSKSLNEDESRESLPPMPLPPPIPAPIHVPPLPIPPSPPHNNENDYDLIEQQKDANKSNVFPSNKEEGITDTSKSVSGPLKKRKYPAGVLEEKRHLIAHLDPECFNPITGRYYGLLSNDIADPQFVGPNAPGITGLNVSGGTGLATAYVGSSNNSGSAGSGGNSSLYYSAGVTSGTGVASGSGATKSGGTGGTGGSGGAASLSGTKKPSIAAATGGTSKAAKVGKGPSPTSTSHELKRIMDLGGEAAEEMRMSIIRAAVYASLSGAHGGSFMGANGETYPDVSKAFSLHGNLRPCNRCKSNKQGAYHCRLRRKHKEVDYDGGDSAGVLAPFFEKPMESLLYPGSS